MILETNKFTARIINDIANSKMFRSRSEANTTVKRNNIVTTGVNQFI